MSKQPRYLEIANIIKQRIKNGSLKPGECLPSQKELSQIFSTSIMTARQALSILEEEGIVSVVHGVGTFIAAPEFHSSDIGLQGFQNEMDKQKLRVDTKVLGKKYDISDTKLESVFKNEEKVFSCLIRLRMIEDKPIILQRSWVINMHKNVVEEYSNDKSLYKFFTEKTGIMIVRGKEIVSPVVMEEEELRLLQLPSDTTAFHSRRVSISLDEDIVLYDEAFMPGPYVIMASSRQGRNNKFKYIINKDGVKKPYESFNDPELWEDLI